MTLPEEMRERNDNPHVEWAIKPLRVLVKYFDDGTIEEWLSNDENDELYLIRSYKHPSGKSPIAKINLQSPTWKG